ncbi:Arabinose 5-phosphate isomerase KdsD [uncultured Roseburia sp.]|uniref:KpsF/GutQ family sugar-phosphate isomerase n=1 Tax=Brotonthovivens ammoniilytica TaxID=2981725 RepID=A0ABT2TF62_9FIRM|nr:KpsF/GutQ family sugar-phosphate isomerase [Brotonthovivens ammoniilytica]MCU6760823.1 KpsF/GutQ family sugar-phosphate isomerase [Brotonthovivens ammoniilytica]SCI10419.1 Arabinose 5-phosphate isomerase KdsD [uncultured Roseburia sp.]
MDILNEVKKIFNIEIEELQKVSNYLDDNIVKVIELINHCRGKIILCGMGKPGHIARKISATMSSLGIQSYVLHPAEALHGDLGTLSKEDILILISNSGETSEICNILPNIKLINIPIVSITSHLDSTLAQYSDYVIALPIFKEACALSLAPTSSTTAALVLGDAIAVVVSELRKFKKEDFALFHPAGALGRKLTVKVSDIMHKNEENPVVNAGVNLGEAIIKMCEFGLGAITIVDENQKLLGLITDGDLKRYIGKREDVYKVNVEDVMTSHPIVTEENILAINALAMMENREKQLSVLPVVREDLVVVGLVRNHDIIKLGIF